MVRLVEYPESSEDERAPSPSDSFSYPMRSPESDDSDDDEDYAPSESSLEPSDSVASSVDTEDLVPDDAMDELAGDERQGERGLFYDWKDLQAAFGDSAFQRRSDTQEQQTQEQKEHEQEEKNRQPNLFDVEAGEWSFQTPFAARADKTRPRRRHTPTRRPTGVSPRFSTMFTGEQSATDTAFTVQSASNQKQEEKQAAEKESKTTFTFQPPEVEIPPFSFDATSGATTPDFTFGSAGSASADTHMRSPSPRRVSAAAFTSVDGGFTIGRSDKAPKPYKFAGYGGKNASKPSAPRSTAQNTIDVSEDSDDTLMQSPSPAKPANRTPTNGEFLFGQGYKNRKPFAFTRQNSSESFHSPEASSTATGTAAKQTTGTSWTTNTPASDPTAASAFFTHGIPGTTAKRNSERRKKVTSSSTFAPPPKNSSTAAPFQTSSSPFASFGSSLFQAATASRHRSEASSGESVGQSASNTRDHGTESSNTTSPKESVAGNNSGAFVFGTSHAHVFTGSSSSPYTSGVFSTTSTETASTSNGGAPGQFVFGNGTAHNPFEFGDDANLHSGGIFSGQQAGNSTASTGDFQIGSTDTKRNPRVRPRRSGMFTNKKSPRKDAKQGADEPEPSPGFPSSYSTAASPFGMHNRRSRKNARLRHTGRSPPADPFVMPTFQSHAYSSTFVSTGEDHQPEVVRPTAQKGFGYGFGASSTSNPFGTTTPQQEEKTGDPSTSQHRISNAHQAHDSSHASVFASKDPAQSSKAHPNGESGPRPGYAGSRRILRAALRGVGVRGDRVSSAPPATTGYHRDGGDAEMDSEDERDWLELKRLGGVAHCSRQYEEAAEYYRQSIEVLEALLDHDVFAESTEIRTDKAKLHANRAASLMMLAQITEAQRECRRSIEADATYARAYLRLGRIQVLLGDTAHAQANIDTAKHLMEGHEGEITRSAKEDHASLVKMEATIKKLTTLQGEIKWYVDCGDFKQALVHTETALTLAPSCRKLQIEKARILLHEREFDQIIQFCTSIIEKQLASHGGTNTKSHKEKSIENVALVGIDLGLLWATTLHYQNKAEDAVRILNALEVVAPCSSHVIQLKRQWQEMKQLKHDGNERFKRGEYQEAVRFYSEAVQIDPQHQEFCAIIYCNRAAAQMGLERYHTAILDCNESLQRKTDYPRALLRRARCHVALKMFHEAVKDFDRYLRGQPSSASTADVRRERNEAKAAIARAREEARQREAAKKRAEREQRQRHQRRWEESSWNDNSRFYENFRRSTNSSNGSSYGSSRYQSSGAGGRASFMAPKTQRRTHYDVLGIEKTATNDQIKKAYRKLALVYHPDKAKTSTHADLFKEMTAAYNVLSDDSARAKYDRELIYNRFGNFYEN